MTDIIAHRGSKGTLPENTLASILKAVELKCEGIEIDVHLSKDKNIIVIHDETVNRTTNGEGYIKDMTLEEIKSLDAGSWFDEKYSGERIPTIEDIINLLNENNYRGFLNIEIKTDKLKYRGIEKRLARILKTENLTFDYIYSSFNIKSLKKIHRFDKGAKKAWLVKNVNFTNRDMNKVEKKYNIEGIHPKYKNIKNKYNFISDLNKNIRPWTVNGNDDILNCFKSNLAGIITDYPEKALEIRKAYMDNKEDICHL